MTLSVPDPSWKWSQFPGRVYGLADGTRAASWPHLAPEPPRPAPDPDWPIRDPTPTPPKPDPDGPQPLDLI